MVEVQCLSCKKRVEFLESLLQLMTTVELLNHKQRIEHEIQSLREDIEREKRREFVRDEILKSMREAG